MSNVGCSPGNTGSTCWLWSCQLKSEHLMRFSQHIISDVDAKAVFSFASLEQQQSVFNHIVLTTCEIIQ